MSSVTINSKDSAAEIMQGFAVGIKAICTAKRAMVNQHFDK